MTQLSQRVRELVRAGFPAIGIRSYESDEVLRELVELATSEAWECRLWDIEQGVRSPGAAGTGDGLDPLSAIRTGATDGATGTQLLVLENLHRFLDSPEVVQALLAATRIGKQSGRHLVFVSPEFRLPPELSRNVTLIDHGLPDRTQLETIARETATEPGEIPEGLDLERLLDAAAGLTRAEAENAFALSLVRHRRLEAEAIWSVKSQALANAGGLRLRESTSDFSAIGGLVHLKEFCREALTRRSRALPRGVLLLGVPGSGKSAFARALGRETRRPVLELDIGGLMGSLVGQTEQRLREALAIVDAMAPAILFVDELEKGLSGAGSSSDGGVTGRLLGTLLTWLNDHTTDVFAIATANDITRLPPEFTRAERFDAVFFLDLPERSEKDAIWAIHRATFEISDSEQQPDDHGWTGAEIRACCRLAALLGRPLTETAASIVPIARGAEDAIERLRQWADGRCLAASSRGIYRRESAPRRRMRRPSLEPGSN
ncbi:MAG TPA: AAA family ATPase [Planctomycetaceae bacterium]|nr:AAA family ATPase [Planctomycetaceae bacterium]HRF00051.1 AAA family ATPase [Pirellulaceae bacterium]